MEIKNAKKIGMYAGVILACAIMLTSVSIVRNFEEGTYSIQLNTALAEAVPGVGESGFLEIFFYPHQAVPGAVYNQNNSPTLEAGCFWSSTFADADAFSELMPAGQTFDIVVKARWNKTHAWTGTQFVDTHCRVKLTAGGGGVAAIGNVTGTLVITTNVSTHAYLWATHYWNNGGIGYTLNTDGTCLINEICVEGKF